MSTSSGDDGLRISNIATNIEKSSEKLSQFSLQQELLVLFITSDHKTFLRNE